MNRFKPLFVSSLTSGLAYGVGFVLGSLLTAFAFSRVTLERLSPGNDIARLVSGIVLAMFISGTGAAFAGFMGGYTLPVVHAPEEKRGYAWKSALVMGSLYGLLLFPLVVALALFSFYNIGEISVQAFMALFAVIGLIIGLLFGLAFGSWTVGLRRVWRAVRYAVVGFGLGGLGLGMGVYRFIYSFGLGQYTWGGRIALLLGLFVFGLGGGTALALAYARYAAEPQEDRPLFSWLTPLWRWVIAIGFILIMLAIFVRPVLSLVRTSLEPQDADLSGVLTSRTVGTHWLDAVDLSAAFDLQAAEAVQIVVAGDGQVGLVWVSDGAVMYTTGLWDRVGKVATWQQPVPVSTGESTAETPQVAIDSQGRAHLVWAEAGTILYGQCHEGACAAPETVSGVPSLFCAAGAVSHEAPTIAVNANDSVMLIWETDTGILPVLNWSAGSSPLSGDGGCVPVAGLAAVRQPRITAASDGRFGLVFTAGIDAENNVYEATFAEAWSEVVELGNGRYPELVFDSDDQFHVLWCDDDGLVYWHTGETPHSLRTPCVNRPQIGIDNNGRLHAVWYADTVEDVFGSVRVDPVLYEISQYEDGWTPPTIIDRVGKQIQAAMVIDDEGTLHMARSSDDSGRDRLQYQAQIQYSCEGYELTALAHVLYGVARLEKYRDPDTPVPFCQNRYDNLVYTPQASAAYSDLEPLTNGAYAQMAQVAASAQYEILLATMWYDADYAGESPGYVIASAVADLYRNVKANPQQYPRGLTVRILLGNPPEFTTGDFTGQLWSVLQDIRDAGVPEMANGEIGWNLEVADYKGALPHSHSKMLIVDGKTVVAAGYNMTYEHYILAHPSGRGAGWNDLGIQVTGPVAQDAVLAFDDLWVGSDQRHCTNFYPAYGVWQASCYDFKATGQHVPEVMRYYVTEGKATAFSMFRSNVRDEADRQIANALAAAEKSIDTMQVNFTMDMICDLDILYDVCTFDEALSFMDGLVTAAENGAHVRILFKGAPIDGIENSVAADILEDEIARRGLEENFELRYFDGPMHYKAINIDNELVIVGSQNFHYSAFAPLSGLTEYNLGVNDERAAEDFAQLFEYHWQRGIPRGTLSEQ